MGSALRVELLYVEGCPSQAALRPQLQRLLLEAGVLEPVVDRLVESESAARAERFLGSPTVRVQGRDVDPTAAGRTDYGLSCRLYATPAGLRGTPPLEWVRAAIAAARARPQP
ncbi:MAG TPA: thioredoxin family protein [Candidatus Dormibacteraeota bacterium]|nr:thioredoxin family protein [Candidatus Dormibacteraeota bacterium]